MLNISFVTFLMSLKQCLVLAHHACFCEKFIWYKKLLTYIPVEVVCSAFVFVVFYLEVYCFKVFKRVLTVFLVLYFCLMVKDLLID